MTKVYRFELPILPPPALSPNARVHWSERYKTGKAFGEAVALVAGATAGREDWPIPFRKVKLKWTLVFSENRWRDIDNYTAMMKSAQDALCAKNIFKFDHADYVKCVGVDIQIGQGEKTICEIEVIK